MSARPLEKTKLIVLHLLVTSHEAGTQVVRIELEGHTNITALPAACLRALKQTKPELASTPIESIVYDVRANA